MKRTTFDLPLLGAPAVLLEAHDGLSAKLAETAGFDGIWASGFAIATALGVRDCNEASWGEVLQAVEHIHDGSRLPILLDGDSGHGDCNVVRRLTAKAEQAGARGIWIEDRVFPKRNSFRAAASQLEPINMQCKKIVAASESRRSDRFAVVARTEALVSGAGIDDALFRAEAYTCAGADAIMVQALGPEPDLLIDFARKWDRQRPLVIAPTAFPGVPFDDFFAEGIQVVICANHLVRTAYGAMRATATRIMTDKCLPADIPSMEDIFDLFNYSGIED